MMKKITLVLIVLAVCAVAMAADAPAMVSGKITTVGEGTITIAIDGDKPVWIKKNAFVKFKDGAGKITDVTADGTTITVKTRKAGQMKAGEAISFQKGKAMAGC